MSITVYGIKNCNTVKKSLDWLNKHQIDYQFHDFKMKGIDLKTLQQWQQQEGLERLINKKGTTFRQLEEHDKNLLNNEAQALKLLMEKPTLIKRPLIEKNGKIISIGYEEEQFMKWK